MAQDGDSINRITITNTKRIPRGTGEPVYLGAQDTVGNFKDIEK